MIQIQLYKSSVSFGKFHQNASLSHLKNNCEWRWRWDSLCISECKISISVCQIVWSKCQLGLVNMFDTHFTNLSCQTLWGHFLSFRCLHLIDHPVSPAPTWCLHLHLSDSSVGHAGKEWWYRIIQNDFNKEEIYFQFLSPLTFLPGRQCCLSTRAWTWSHWTTGWRGRSGRQPWQFLVWQWRDF